MFVLTDQNHIYEYHFMTNDQNIKSKVAKEASLIIDDKKVFSNEE